MALNLSQIETIGGFACHYSPMAAPVVRKAMNCSRKSSSSSSSNFFARSDLSCRAFSSVDKIKIEGDEQVDEPDYRDTPYVPVYVMLPSGIIGSDNELVYCLPKLRTLKSMNVDGVKVECWWGIVERLVPRQYDWSQYKRLVQNVKECNLKLQVVFCFHAYVGDDLHIPLPRWVMEVGKKDPNIFFTDRHGRRIYECLTWGIDHETVLMNRAPSSVYQNFMDHFHKEFEEFFVDGTISGIEIGLGPCGELQFPFQTPGFSSRDYPAIEEFPCYDEYMMKSLKKAWKERGEPLSGVRTSTKGSHDRSTWRHNYLCEMSRLYISFYGRFFLSWYQKVMVDHAKKLLLLTRFECNVAVKIPGICHLWYDAPIISTLKNSDTSISCKCGELQPIYDGEDFPEVVAEEMGMGWQVLNAAWAADIRVEGENDLPCYDRRGFQEILEVAKPTNDPIGRHLSSFTYHRLSPQLMEKHNLNEFGRFVQKMHGRSTT